MSPGLGATKLVVAGDTCFDHASSPVVSFLQDAGLGQYARSFIVNGFDEMETLMDMQEADMYDLGLPNYHIVKLRRRLQDLQGANQGGGLKIDPNHPVVVFLRETGLVQYAQVLLRSGFDDMETLVDIEDADLKDMGIPRGHAVKLKKRLREQRQPQATVTSANQTAGIRAPAPAPTPAEIFPKLEASGVAYQMPSEHTKNAVTRSWEHIQALGTFTVGELLYRNLFQIFPEAMDLYPPEVRHRYRDWDELSEESFQWSGALRKLFAKVVNAIGYAVAGLHDIGRLVPMLMQLGMRHAAYGTRAEHFKFMGEALNKTLLMLLGSEFTPEVEVAWQMVYNFASAIMLEGLKSAEHQIMQMGSASGAGDKAIVHLDDKASDSTTTRSHEQGAEQWRREEASRGGGREREPPASFVQSSLAAWEAERAELPALLRSLHASRFGQKDGKKLPKERQEGGAIEAR